MMRILILTILIFLGFKISYGQDTLYKKDNSKVIAIVKEITPTEIKYKLFNNPDGPLYTIYKSDIVLILFSNGTHQVITSNSNPKKEDINQAFIDEYWRRKDSTTNAKKNITKAKLDRFTNRKNIIFLNIPEIANLGVGIDFIHEFKDERFQLFSTLSISGGDLVTEEKTVYNYNSYSTNNVMTTRRPLIGGIGFLINTGKRKFVSLNVGPCIKFAQYNGKFNELTRTFLYHDTVYNYDVTRTDITEHTFVMNKFLFQLNLHLILRISEKLNLMGYLNATVFQTTDFVAGNPAAYFPPGYNLNRSLFGSGFPNSFSQFGLSIGYRFNFKNKKPLPS